MIKCDNCNKGITTISGSYGSDLLEGLRFCSLECLNSAKNVEIKKLRNIIENGGLLLNVDEQSTENINKFNIKLGEEVVHEDKLRPSHYKKGKDTFSWAEDKYSTEQLQAIAEFNIHKYSSRKKGQDILDFGKVADYALWIKSILEK